ncbi:hypothetical protein TMatcc_010846 [Talaromyces marneffei ATCC 18224]|uniref:Thaumatin-like protein n=1 Tax=Talaromyces marneffei PM1 TaxID=1077442 RepID=A0A093W220_TALMA|nr:uncharacterized protein EYB26_009398 [Talaromyces marneffei]KAE8548345.1 hypothetical protein EYB25_008723 [Talaromyces marneffei]QGA21687.1 hypothetical protein EYB26_009398 [Talaromyces marneffei]
MMFTKTITAIASLGALASALPATMQRRDDSAAGGVDIINNMNSTVYLWSVSNTADSPMVTLAPGEQYSEEWRLNPNGGGISIKMSTAPDHTDILQYEYTLSDPTIFWDLSCIDMADNSPFTAAGFAVTNNNTDICPSATCKPGDTACNEAYLIPTDDHATHGCPHTVRMTLNLGPSLAE